MIGTYIKKQWQESAPRGLVNLLHPVGKRMSVGGDRAEEPGEKPAAGPQPARESNCLKCLFSYKVNLRNAVLCALSPLSFSDWLPALSIFGAPLRAGEQAGSAVTVPFYGVNSYASCLLSGFLKYLGEGLPL